MLPVSALKAKASAVRAANQEVPLPKLFFVLDCGSICFTSGLLFIEGVNSLLASGPLLKMSFKVLPKILKIELYLFSSTVVSSPLSSLGG